MADLKAELAAYVDPPTFDMLMADATGAPFVMPEEEEDDDGDDDDVDDDGGGTAKPCLTDADLPIPSKTIDRYMHAPMHG